VAAAAGQHATGFRQTDPVPQRLRHLANGADPVTIFRTRSAVGAAVFIPAGLGVREAVLLIGLGSVMSGGQAAVVVVAARLWLTLLELVCVGLAWLVPYPDQGNVDGPSERTVPAKQSDPSAPLESKDG
jgi:hypothetical protein